MLKVVAYRYVEYTHSQKYIPVPVNHSFILSLVFAPINRLQDVFYTIALRLETWFPPFFIFSCHQKVY